MWRLSKTAIEALVGHTDAFCEELAIAQQIKSMAGYIRSNKNCERN
jgi:hypothetical protein